MSSVLFCSIFVSLTFLNTALVLTFLYEVSKYTQIGPLGLFHVCLRKEKLRFAVYCPVGSLSKTAAICNSSTNLSTSREGGERNVSFSSSLSLAGYQTGGGVSETEKWICGTWTNQHGKNRTRAKRRNLATSSRLRTHSCQFVNSNMTLSLI